MNPVSRPRAPRRLRSGWMAAIVLALGAGSVLLLFSSNFLREVLIATDILALREIEEIQTHMATAHLWIEEYVTGDSVDLAEIEYGFSRSEELVGAIRLRDAQQAGAPLRPSPQIEISELTRRVADRIQTFAQLTSNRRRDFEAGAAVGIGSATDVVYDRAFENLRSDLGELRRRLGSRLAASERRARLLFRGLLLAWVAIIGMAALALWSRDRGERQMGHALDQSQAQLLQAQKMEAVGRLAGGLAHDINNYLAAIAAQCELVRMSEESDGTVERMNAVLATTSRASALLERLLAFSRRQPAHPEPVDLNVVLAGLDNMLPRFLGEDVALDLRLGEDLWPVRIDVSQLEQVILNLAVNAREAMPTGGTLTIETENVPGLSRRRRQTPVKDQVALRVSDTGSGIPRSIRDKIFEPFFTTKERAHSGLGLATVLGVIEQNGGRIAIESTTKQGTTFEVRFPRSSKAAVSVPTEAAETVTDRSSGRVLLAEDNAELRRSTRDLLEAWGYKVNAAADGEEALALFEATGGAIDLLVTDVVMPNLGGRELAERIRRRAPTLPILFVSGHTDDVVLRHGIAAGEVDFLAKPFSARELADRVRSALKEGP